MATDRELLAAIGARIRRVRLARGMTQAQLGGRSGRTHSMVSLWEKAENGMSALAAVSVAGALAVPVGWLLTGGHECPACRRPFKSDDEPGALCPACSAAIGP